jgi:hypothetical protein
MILAMRWITSFWRWVLVFAGLGFLVPLVVMFRYGVMGSNSMFGDRLWISSWLLMGIDTPNPGAVSKYSLLAFAWGSNIVLYAVLGAVGWLVVSVVLRLLGPGETTKAR